MAGIPFAIEASTSITLILSLPLSAYLTVRYMRKKSMPRLLWCTGFWIFSLETLLEMIFSVGTVSYFLIRTYLFLAAIMVNILALGAVEMMRSKRSVQKISAYYIYSLLTAILLAYTILTTDVFTLVENGTVSGAVPNSVIIASSLITIPGAIILAAVSLYGYMRRHKARMLALFAGIIVMSAGGFLYIASMPYLNYYTDFIGILLFWIGVIGL